MSKREGMIANLLLGSIKSIQWKFRVNIFMPVTKFPCLIIWLFFKRRPFQICGQFRGLFQETNNKNWGFCVKKEGERKNTDD